MWQEQYDKLSTTEKNQFSEAANRLLAVNFLVKSKSSNTQTYYFIDKYFKIFKDYFAFIAWDLEIDRTVGVIILRNNENRNRLNLKIHESITLLILRLLYEQNSDELDINDYVSIKVADIHEMFAIVGLENRILNKKTMNEVLSLFKRYNLIEADGVSTLATSDEVQILPSILLAVDTINILDVYNKLRDYNKEDGETDEVTEED
jgi:hypothetical protein